MSKIEKLEYKGIRYLLYYPKNYEVGKKYPIMFHLHGAGSRGTDFKEFEGSLILEILNRGDSPLSNGFCVFPQCSTDNWFDKFSELLGIPVGGCTADREWSLEACRCIGCCGLAPVATVNDEVFGNLTEDKVADIIKKFEGIDEAIEEVTKDV